jgi:SPP1 family predicted phage head-tail adaptor
MVERIKLITINESGKDAIGQPIETETISEPLADITGVTQTEFFSAGQRGLQPEAKFTVWAHEYNGEKLLEYNGSRYAIYRTYPVNGRIELYAGWRIGTYTF